MRFQLRMPILYRYLMKEFIPPFLMGAFGFMLFMMSDLMFLLVDQVVNRGAPLIPALKVLVLRIPAFLILALPVATLFGAFSSLTNLESNYEITILKILGIRAYHLMLPYLILGTLVSLTSWTLNETIVPTAMRKSREIVRTMLYKTKAPMIEPNVFFKTPSGDVVFVRSINKKTKELNYVLILRLQKGVFPEIITAEKGFYTQSEWVLQNGILTRLDPKGMVKLQAKFKELRVNIKMSIERMASWKYTPWEMKYSELKERVEDLEKRGLKATALKTQMYAKVSLPFSCLVVIILAVPLSVLFAKAGKFIGITLSVGFLFVYYSIFSVFQALGKKGVISPFLGAWGANILMLALGVILFLSYDRR